MSMQALEQRVPFAACKGERVATYVDICRTCGGTGSDSRRLLEQNSPVRGDVAIFENDKGRFLIFTPDHEARR